MEQTCVVNFNWKFQFQILIITRLKKLKNHVKLNTTWVFTAESNLKKTAQLLMLINSIDKKIFWTVASLNRQCENVLTYLYLAYLYICIFTKRCHSISLSHLCSRDNQGQETFLAPSANKQIRLFGIFANSHHELSVHETCQNRVFLDIYPFLYLCIL